MLAKLIDVSYDRDVWHQLVESMLTHNHQTRM